MLGKPLYKLLTISSWWHLLSAQVESASHNRRIWRKIHTYWTSESRVCEIFQHALIDRLVTDIILQAAIEVEPLEPTYGPLKETIASMQERGIQTLYGRWLIEGAPRVLLIDTGTGYRWLDEWKADLWNTAGIPSPASDSETNEAIIFGYLVAWFLGEVSRDMAIFCCTC